MFKKIIILKLNFSFTASTEEHKRQDIELPKISKEILLDRIAQDSQAYPPDLLSFPLRPTSQISPSNRTTSQEKPLIKESPKSPTYSISSINSALYSRLHNTSYQEMPLVTTKGYVTLPRRPRLSYPENTLPFTNLNGVIPYYDNFNNFKLFSNGGNYYSLNKSEMDLGPVNKLGFMDVCDDIEPAPSPAPGTPHATIPRNSLSSPNIHNQLLMLQAMSNKHIQRSTEHRPLKVTLTENESLLKMRDSKGYSVNVASTLGKIRNVSNPTPKTRKRTDVKETFLDTIDNATQV